MSKLYAILPEFAVEWEQRKIAALARLPRAELSSEKKRNIEDSMDESREHIRQYLSMMYNQRRSMTIEDGVATIHVHDYLGKNQTFIEKCMGASSYEDIVSDLNRAKNDSSVRHILLDIDSGGGSAAGCVEVGRIVGQISDIKEVHAYTEGYCCSAAYAIAVGADRIYSSPSAFVGSIGTIYTLIEYGRMLSNAGIGVHEIKSKGADLKGSGSDTREPTAQEAEYLQGIADEYGYQFTEWVKENRILPDEAYRGQGFSGRDAHTIGLTDGVMDRSELVDWLKQLPGKSG